MRENRNQRKAELTRKVDLPQQIYLLFNRQAGVLYQIQKILRTRPKGFSISDKTRAARVLNGLKYSSKFNSRYGQS